HHRSGDYPARARDHGLRHGEVGAAASGALTPRTSRSQAAGPIRGRPPAVRVWPAPDGAGRPPSGYGTGVRRRVARTCERIRRVAASEIPGGPPAYGAGVRGEPGQPGAARTGTWPASRPTLGGAGESHLLIDGSPDAIVTPCQRHPTDNTATFVAH